MTIKNDERAQSMTQLKFISFQPKLPTKKPTKKPSCISDLIQFSYFFRSVVLLNNIKNIFKLII